MHKNSVPASNRTWLGLSPFLLASEIHHQLVRTRNLLKHLFFSSSCQIHSCYVAGAGLSTLRGLNRVCVAWGQVLGSKCHPFPVPPPCPVSPALSPSRIDPAPAEPGWYWLELLTWGVLQHRRADATGCISSVCLAMARKYCTALLRHRRADTSSLLWL